MRNNNYNEKALLTFCHDWFAVPAADGLAWHRACGTHMEAG